MPDGLRLKAICGLFLLTRAARLHCWCLSHIFAASLQMCARTARFSQN